MRAQGDEVEMGMTMSVGLAVVLMLGVAAWSTSAEFTLVARATVCAIALMAALHAARTDRSVWVFGLVIIAVLLSTLVPVVMPRTVTLWAIAGCLTAIAAWLMVLQRTVPTLAVAQVLHPPEAAR